MPDYQKGKIYKLWSPSKNLVYYGSTTQSISQRLADHLKNFKTYIKHFTPSKLPRFRPPTKF
jgi:predicted GIY-YIG superfamily endonuclease